MSLEDRQCQLFTWTDDLGDGTFVVAVAMSVSATQPKPPVLLLVPFLVLAVLFTGSYLLAMHRVSRLRDEAENLEQDMLTDIQLVSRMQRDLDYTELRVDRHVFENESAAWATLDTKIGLAQADYDAAATKYESLPLLPGEEGPWLSLKGVMADLRPHLEEVLARSRAGDDVAAHHELVKLEGSFSRANEAFSALIAFNQREAKESVARVADFQRSSTAILQVLALAGVVLSASLGVAMTRDIQQRNVRLSRYAERLEASNRELDAFAGRVAHDLRGPLGTATLAASHLSTQLPSPGQTKALGALGRSFDRMGGVIEDLLAFSRATSSAGAVSDPAEAADQLREELTPKMDGSDMSLAVDVHPAAVHCGKGLLRQVLWNLTDNAMKYRRGERLRVEIVGRSVNGLYELSVCDNGVGMSPEEASRIFEPFYRTEDAKRKPGTGLGLSIVRRLVEAHGGTVSVMSDRGRGSTFMARLPLA